MNWENIRVLVVGGAGFVGSNLCFKLLTLNTGHITIVDNLLSADMVNVPRDPRVTFILGSIAEDRILMQLGDNYDFVFHLATYHGNQSSIADPIADHDNNTLPTLKLCEHFKHSKRLQKFVYAAAGCTVAKKTFDETEATAEDAPISLYLDSPYQISKIIGEFYGNYYFMRYQLPFVKARFQNVYGPREILGAGRWRGTPATVWRNVLPIFIWKALHQEALPIENGGIATRDFIYVDDLVNGLIACAIHGEASEVYNLASGQEISIKAVADLINTLTNNKAIPIDSGKRSWDRSGRRFGNTHKSAEKLGFTAKVSIEEGLQRTLAWTKAHQSIILQCMRQHLVFMPELQSYFQKNVTSTEAINA